MNNENEVKNHEEKSSGVSPKDENQDRGNWDNKADYMLSCIGYAVGLGNVWRFPYLAFENGGGAFLIPYIIMLVFAGLPIFFLECALGQFSSLGPISLFKFSPIWKGLGYTMVVLNIIVTIYYNIILGYTIFYFFSSFTGKLPWESCNNYWNNNKTCSTTFRKENNETTGNINESICDLLLSQSQLGNYNVSQYLSDNSIDLDIQNGAIGVSSKDGMTIARYLGVDVKCVCSNERSFRGTSASEEYWDRYALHRSANIDETGTIVTPMALSLLLAWIVLYFSMIRGIKSSGKVVYFTALFPYVVLLILLIRGATLDGAIDGIQYYIGNGSQIEKLQDADVWKKAATQIFFSLSAAWGGLIALSSYNKFQNNCFLDSIIVCLVNCATSIFAGLSIFTVVGYMAKKLGREVGDVVSNGFGLAFIAYPEAIAALPASPAWALLFFLMLFTLGLDSQFTGIEAILTAAMDMFPRQLRSRRAILTLTSCIMFFLLGLPCVAESGIYWLTLIDSYTADWGLIIVAVLEVIAVSWVYGGNRFIQDIEMMIGKKHWAFWLYWRACWFFITPLLLLAVLIWSLVTFTPPSYGGVAYPVWANVIGWCAVAFVLLFIPLMAIVAIVKNNGNIFQASCPEADWGPYLKKFRGERYQNMQEPYEALQLRKNVREEGETNPVYQVHDEETTKM